MIASWHGAKRATEPDRRDPGGSVVAGGAFTSAGGVRVKSVARWDGREWSAMDAGMSTTVCSLMVTRDGELIAGVG